MTTLLSLFATCPRGVEPLLATELSGFGAVDARERRGGAAFSGDLAVAYRACLWSRLANRVLLPLTTFTLEGDNALYAGGRQVDWTAVFGGASTFAIEVAGRSPLVSHTHFAGLKIKDAVADSFREKFGERPNVDLEQPDIRIHLHLDRGNATLSLDLAGDSLHRRGYRSGAGEAPLKENLAAAILVRSGWPAIAARGGALLDPMCGSGTLVLEAGLMAADVAPGLARSRWGFEAWLQHQPAIWSDIRKEAVARREAGLAWKLPPLIGSDIDGGVLRQARNNAERAGLARHIRWTEADVSEARPVGDEPGLVVTNPPYGERLGSEGEIIKLYSLLGAGLKLNFPGWHASVFTGRPDLGPRLGLRANSLHSLYNGAIECKLLQFDIAPRAAPPAAADPASPTLPAAAAGGEDFANRLRKKLKHLGKWAKRSGVDNYRLYDADLPDYALAVDIYQAGELHLHVQEYAAPDTVDPHRAERRLRDALAQLQILFELPASRIHYKLRKSQLGSSQYQKQDEQLRFAAIIEHGCKLWVNFDDYLDTGLFLDHRPLRLRIQREAAGKRFLNLFCYTASASVHAAVGGAVSTTSVDLSNTYLDWGRRNLDLNGFRVEAPERRSVWGAAVPTGAHQLLRADCLVWLREQAEARRGPRYDLILCDPPTFSNSKKMEGVLDTQRDHAELILNSAALLAPGGRLYFSTNRRRFKLDTEALAGLAITDITGQTLDEDFKRPPPAHRCWMIQGTATKV